MNVMHPSCMLHTAGLLQVKSSFRLI